MKKEGSLIRNLNSDILPRHKGRTASVTDKLHFHTLQFLIARQRRPTRL